MANSILEKVSEELGSLDKELKSFKQAVNYLSDAKANVETAVNTVKAAENYHLKNMVSIEKSYKNLEKLQDILSKHSEKIEGIDFPGRLAIIENNLSQVIESIDNSTKSTLSELSKASATITKADFEGKFRNLDELITKAKENTEDVATNSQKLILSQTQKTENSLKSLEASSKQVSKEQLSYLRSLTLENRFEKLTASVLGILTAVQSLKGQLDLVERNIGDKIQSISDQNNNIQSAISQSNENLLDKIQTSSKKHIQLNYITIGLGVIIILFMLLNNYKII